MGEHSLRVSVLHGQRRTPIDLIARNGRLVVMDDNNHADVTNLTDTQATIDGFTYTASGDEIMQSSANRQAGRTTGATGSGQSSTTNTQSAAARSAPNMEHVRQAYRAYTRSVDEGFTEDEDTAREALQRLESAADRTEFRSYYSRNHSGQSIESSINNYFDNSTTWTNFQQSQSRMLMELAQDDPERLAELYHDVPSAYISPAERQLAEFIVSPQRGENSEQYENQLYEAIRNKSNNRAVGNQAVARIRQQVTALRRSENAAQTRQAAPAAPANDNANELHEPSRFPESEREHQIQRYRNSHNNTTPVVTALDEPGWFKLEDPQTSQPTSDNSSGEPQLNPATRFPSSELSHQIQRYRNAHNNAEPRIVHIEGDFYKLEDPATRNEVCADNPDSQLSPVTRFPSSELSHQVQRYRNAHNNVEPRIVHIEGDFYKLEDPACNTTPPAPVQPAPAPVQTTPAPVQPAVAVHRSHRRRSHRPAQQQMQAQQQSQSTVVNVNVGGQPQFAAAPVQQFAAFNYNKPAETWASAAASVNQFVPQVVYQQPVYQQPVYQQPVYQQPAAEPELIIRNFIHYRAS